MFGCFGTDRNWLPRVVTLTGWREFPWSTSRSCKPSIRSSVICYLSISCFIDHDVARLRWPKARSIGGVLSVRSDLSSKILRRDIPLWHKNRQNGKETVNHTSFFRQCIVFCKTCCMFRLLCIRVRLPYLTLRRLMSYIYGAPILDVSRSHTTTHHSR